MARTIVYYGGCWPTNIGNAFIDFGSLQSLKMAFPNDRVVFASEFTRWFFQSRGRAEHAVSMVDRIECDYLVVSGMNCCDEFLEVEGPVVRAAARRGVKVLFSGCGQLTYEDGETERFRQFLAGVEPVAFISRDEVTYQNLHDVCPHSFSGVDCAFFLPEAHRAPKMRGPAFTVLNFDHGKAPRIETETQIIRAHHQCIKAKKRWFKRPDTLISDIPEDYLNVYANCEATHSDRVHACIATLAYGNRAQLYSTTSRAHLFEKVGAGEIHNRPVSIDVEALAEMKSRQVEFLRSCMT